MDAAVRTRPVVAYVGVNDAFQLYSGNVFGCNPAVGVNHGILVVGITADGDWIIKNSWGTSWGADGFMILSRNNNCKMTTMEGYRAFV